MLRLSFLVLAHLAMATVANSQNPLADAASNPLADYGIINQKSVGPVGPPAIGLWACGPTALANSLGYLERRFPAYYRKTLVPDTNGNTIVDDAEIKAVAEQLCAALYMDLRPPAGNTQAPCTANTYYPDIYGRGENNGPGGEAGGVTFPRFALGKNCWFTRVGVPATTIRGEYRDAWPGVPHPAKPAWLTANVMLDARKIFDDIARGYDVEIGFTWQPEFGGGHFVTVRAYDFKNGDTNRNGVLDVGESAGLRIIDPWDPAACGITLPANPPDLPATLTKNAAGELFISYVGGAAGPFPGSSGRLRIWCSEGVPVCGGRPAGAMPHGAGKAGTNGVGAWDLGTPVRTPILGSTYPLRLVNGLAGSSPIVVIGTPLPAGFPLPPIGTIYVLPIIVTISMPPFNATNTSVLPLSIPNGANLCGLTLGWQGFWPDPGAVGFLGHSNGLTLIFGD